MKKLIILINLLVTVFLLSSCSIDKAVPLEDPEIELFEVIFEGSKLSIYKRIEIDEIQAFTMEAYYFGEKGDQCIVGSSDRYNYRFLYKGNYYDIYEVNKLNLLTCSELRGIGIIDE